MANALSVDRVVKVTINLQPLAASRRNFGILCIAGPSDVIGQDERIRAYTNIAGVAADFGVNAPEYKAAELFFSQTPRPAILHIGRWVRAAAPAMLKGAVLSDAEQALSLWSAVEDGAMSLTIDGTEHALSGLDFSGCMNLNGVASVVTAALSGAGTCLWTGDRFTVTSATSGATSAVLYAETAASGTDAASMMKLTEAAATGIVPGMDGETPVECAAALADMSGNWYGLAFAASDLTVEQHLAVAAFIEASAKSRIYGATVTDTRVLDSTYTEDLASRCKALGYKRTMVAYSANPYAVVSAIGRAFTVNFSANRSTITLKFKQLPGITAEGLTETYAANLAAKRCNVFAAYDNGTAIYQEGVMSGDAWFDEIHGLDWLQNAVQTEVWNLLYQSKTKVPQTDSDANQILAAIESVFQEGVNNGLIAPGVWNGDGFGLLE